MYTYGQLRSDQWPYCHKTKKEKGQDYGFSN